MGSLHDFLVLAGFAFLRCLSSLHCQSLISLCNTYPLPLSFAQTDAGQRPSQSASPGLHSFLIYMKQIFFLYQYLNSGIIIGTQEVMVESTEHSSLLKTGNKKKLGRMWAGQTFC